MEKWELEERAARRGGVLSVADLDAAGLSPGGIQTVHAAGRIVRLRRGVYTTRRIVAELAGDKWAMHALQVKAALSVADDTAAAAGASAAALHRMDMLGGPPSRPVLVRPVEIGANGKHSGTTAVRIARLPEAHLTRVDGWPVTTVARTLVDVARRQGERCAVVAGDAALRMGLDLAGLDRVLADCSRSPGIRAAREMLALCDGRAESPLESLTRLVLDRGGIPRPALQIEIGEFRVDFCWPSARLILEADGKLKYAEASDLFREKQREDWLRSKGYRVLRTDWPEVFNREASLCRRVAHALMEAAA
jgi:very-short-patch-repair endonuclease/predicted transcriptional regulator of viral defense system